MEPKKDNAATKTVNLSVSDGDGLFLTGLVMTVEVNDKSWENEEYKQLKATIIGGDKTFFFTASDKNGDKLPEVHSFKRARVRVDWARA